MRCDGEHLPSGRHLRIQHAIIICSEVAFIGFTGSHLRLYSFVVDVLTDRSAGEVGIQLIQPPKTSTRSGDLTRMIVLVPPEAAVMMRVRRPSTHTPANPWKS